MISDPGRVVAAARLWLGTPYRHQASVPGAGCDCLGLIRGVWRELLGREPVVVPAYSSDWRQRGQSPHLQDAAAKHLIAWKGGPDTGVVVLFRLGHDRPARHCGIIVAPDRFIHAREHLGVIETRLTPPWTRRVASLHAFPAVPKPGASSFKEPTR